MGLANVQGFLTSDGKFFFKDDKAAAEQHEAELQFREWCRFNICIGGEWTSGMVANEVLANFNVTPRVK